MSALTQMLLASYGGSSGGGGAFTPQGLTGLQAWWDLSDEATLTIVDNKIAAVADKAGGAIGLVQPSLSERFTHGVYAGLSVGVGSGGQWMQPAATLALSTGAFWAFAVARASSDAILLDGFGAGVNPYLLSARASRMFSSLADGDLELAGASGTFDATADLYTAVATGSGLTHSLNSQQAAGGMNDGFTVFYVGGRAGFRGLGLLCECFVGSGSLSAGDIAAAKTYLKTKWGTP